MYKHLFILLKSQTLHWQINIYTFSLLILHTKPAGQQLIWNTRPLEPCYKHLTDFHQSVRQISVQHFGKVLEMCYISILNPQICKHTLTCIYTQTHLPTRIIHPTYIPTIYQYMHVYRCTNERLHTHIHLHKLTCALRHAFWKKQSQEQIQNLVNSSAVPKWPRVGCTMDNFGPSAFFFSENWSKDIAQYKTWFRWCMSS